MWQNALSERTGGRARIGWWLFVAVLAAAALFIAYSFVGMLVLGVFGYYATRPIYRRLDAVIGRDGIAAALTIVLVTGPIILLAVYAGFQMYQQVQQLFAANTSGFTDLVRGYFGIGQLTPEQQRAFTSLLRSPTQVIDQPGQVARTLLGAGLRVLSAIFGTILLLALSLTVTFSLLEREEQLSAALIELFGGRDTTAYAYASLVDEDLESVFFGNFQFVLVMAVVAAVAYWATNMLTPPALTIPMIFTLAFLTGVASLVPIVVGKVIYIPVVAYLGLQAVRTGGNQLPLVGGILLVYVLVLDLLPQTFLQPYITGRKLDMLLLLFGYILGPMLFGWYGFFFLPMIFVVMLEAIRVVLPQLIHGEPLTGDVTIGEGVGFSARHARDDVSDEGEPDAN